MAPHLVRAQSAYKDIISSHIQTNARTHAHIHTHTKILAFTGDGLVKRQISMQRKRGGFSSFSSSPAAASSQLLSESWGGGGSLRCLAQLCSMKQTRITLHAFCGWRRRPQRRQCHLCFAIPMLRCTVVRVELWVKLYRLCGRVVGRCTGVMSQGLILHISTCQGVHPGEARFLQRQQTGQFLKILASCTDPGHLATTLINFRSASQMTWKQTNYIVQLIIK